MAIKRIIETRFPQVASLYRYVRDRRKAANWKRSMTPLGFEMVGVEGMGESRCDSGELALLLELIPHKEVFVDVGANCGLFTLAARQAGLHCVAVEPNLDNLSALLANLQLNEFTDVEVFPIAISSRADVMPLFGGGEGASLEANWGGMVSTYSRLVPVNSLDQLVGRRFVEKRALVKVDVEGHEFEVLSGASELLARDPAPGWLLEHGFRENFAGEVNPHFRDLFQLFWDNGYQCVTADSARRTVNEEDVTRWLRQGERDFGYLNYFMFKEPSVSVP